jgi:hypothetical protein
VGSAAGGAVVCLVLFVMAGVALPAAAGSPHPIMPAFGPGLAAGGGAVAAAVVAWSVARPLAHAYVRAALAMMAVMGTALVAAVSLPAHLLLGRAGLVLLAALCVAAIAAARRLLLEPRR